MPKATKAEELAAALGIRMYCIGLGKDEPTVLPRFDTRTGKIYRDVLGKTIPMQTINPANYEMLGKMAKVANGRFYRALDQNQLSRVYEEIDRLESDADRVMRSAMSKLFREEPEVREVIKLKAIYELLETITDKCEDVANLIEGVVLENS